MSFAQKNCDELVIEGDQSKWEFIDPIKVANLHNFYLEQAVKLRLSNDKATDKEVLMNIELLNVPKEYLSCLIDNISNTNELEIDKVIISNFTDNNSKNIYNELLEVLSDERDLNTISKDASVLRENIKKLKSQKDRDILFTCLETGLASAKFWLPKKNGGDGFGYMYQQKSLVNKQDDTRFKKDMRGAGYGMVCWSFSALLGPVGGAGLAYGAISGAVVSSFLP